MTPTEAIRRALNMTPGHVLSAGDAEAVKVLLEDRDRHRRRVEDLERQHTPPHQPESGIAGMRMKGSGA